VCNSDRLGSYEILSLIGEGSTKPANRRPRASGRMLRTRRPSQQAPPIIEADRMLKWSLFFVTICCFGQGVQTWIDPDSVQLSAEKLEPFLNLICPGHVWASGCDACPEISHSGAGSWQVRAFHPGHFVSPKSEDMLISGSGCEDHADDFGGSVLLARNALSWRRVRYVAGMIADQCRKLNASDGRDRLICRSDHDGQGVHDPSLFVLDPGAPLESGQTGFIGVEDTTWTCGDFQNGIIRSGMIERVEFAALPAKYHSRIVVTARLGKASIPEKTKSCNPRLNVAVATVPRRYEFTFDGVKVLPDPKNPPTAAPSTSYSIAKCAGAPAHSVLNSPATLGLWRTAGRGLTCLL
jgi:hypothetical protein